MDNYISDLDHAQHLGMLVEKATVEDHEENRVYFLKLYREALAIVNGNR